LKREICPCHPAAIASLWIAERCKGTHRRFAEDVLFDASRAHRCGGDQVLHLAGANGQGAEVRVAGPSVHLAPDAKRNLLSFQQTDVATEEGHQVGAPAGLEADPEIEDVRAFQEKRTLLGKEQ
jgi:hypothetical protein